jgi:cytochrome c biogenesis protein CcdA
MLFLTVKRTDRSSTELAGDILHDGRELVRLEIELAKREVRELLVRNAVAVSLLAFAVLLLLIAILVAVPVLLVQLWSDHVLGAVIWIGAYVVLALLLGLVGRLLLRLEAPPRTLSSLKETREWVLRQISSSDR